MGCELSSQKPGAPVDAELRFVSGSLRFADCHFASRSLVGPDVFVR